MADFKVFRDPIHNLIAFDKKEDKSILEIINTPEFQRLRRIRQLGLAAHTFPTVSHDRFSHSLGVCFLVGELFDNLNTPDKVVVQTSHAEKIKLTRQQLKLLLKLAGLLHDIGHGPFSHAFEKITLINHEDLSIGIIKDEDGNILPILKDIDDETLKKYAVNWIIEILQGTFSPTWAKELISSQLDADRMDYLLRDAYMCGVNYASFDLKWLFHNMEIGEIKHQKRDGLIINAQKGIHGIEAFIVSRYHMYAQVYFHKTTRGFELIVQKIFERLKSLNDAKKVKQNMFLNENLPNFINDNNDLKAYLALDDFNMYTHFNHWLEHSEDKILKDLCENIIHRKPYKMVKQVENDNLYDREEYKTISKEIFGHSEELEKYYFLEDDYSSIAYKDLYLLGKTTSNEAELIWLKYSDNNIKELSQVSPIANALKNKVSKRKRAYIHRNYNQKYKSVVSWSQPG